MSFDRPRQYEPPLSFPDDGGRVDDLGRHELENGAQGGADLRPFVGVVDRPMLGGLRTAHYAQGMKDEPGFDGGHVVLTNRRPVVILAPHEESAPEEGAVLPSLRVPPQSDPYGRMCLNAATATAAGR